MQEFRFGMKVLRPENWVTPDTIHANFGLSDMTRAPDPLEQGRRDVEHLCNIDLTDAATDEVKAMFEVAKATMAYGWFFYPLYSVGADRLKMLLELAVRQRFESLYGEQRYWNYRQGLVWLCEQRHIDDHLCEWLQMSRGGRNDALHAKFQSVFTFGNAVREAYHTARLLAEFYAYERPPHNTLDLEYHHHHFSPLDPQHPNNAPSPDTGAVNQGDDR